MFSCGALSPASWSPRSPFQTRGCGGSPRPDIAFAVFSDSRTRRRARCRGSDSDRRPPLALQATVPIRSTRSPRPVHAKRHDGRASPQVRGRAPVSRVGHAELKPRTPSGGRPSTPSRPRGMGTATLLPWSSPGGRRGPDPNPGTAGLRTSRRSRRTSHSGGNSCRPPSATSLSPLGHGRFVTSHRAARDRNDGHRRLVDGRSTHGRRAEMAAARGGPTEHPQVPRST